MSEKSTDPDARTCFNARAFQMDAISHDGIVLHINFDAGQCRTCAQRLIEHDLVMPQVVGYPPKSDHEIKIVVKDNIHLRL